MKEIFLAITFLITTQYQEEQNQLGVKWGEHPLIGYEEKISEFAYAIYHSSREYHIDPHLISVLIWRESRFITGQVGSKGERGVMQLHGIAARKCKFDTIYQQVDCGARWLSYLIQRCQSVHKGLGAYAIGRCKETKIAKSRLKLYHKLCRVTER